MKETEINYEELYSCLLHKANKICVNIDYYTKYGYENGIFPKSKINTSQKYLRKLLMTEDVDEIISLFNTRASYVDEKLKSIDQKEMLKYLNENIEEIKIKKGE